MKKVFCNQGARNCNHTYEKKNNSPESNYKIHKYRWWYGLENLPLININIKKIKENLKHLLYEATKIRLVADVNIATSLSVGVDSAIIFAILN